MECDFRFFFSFKMCKRQKIQNRFKGLEYAQISLQGKKVLQKRFQITLGPLHCGTTQVLNAQCYINTQ